METYSKLSSSLIHSTVWREPDHVRLVWITMLAIADRHGVVRASVPGLADAARVSLDLTVEALARFSGPDQWSRSKADDGRRIREVPGGWELVNHQIYRALGVSDERRTQVREAVRKHRKLHKKNNGNQGKQRNSPDQDQDQDQDQIRNRSEKEDIDDHSRADAGSDPVQVSAPILVVQNGSDTKGKRKRAQTMTPAFVAFWKIYPRKVAKAEALKAWIEQGAEDFSEKVVTAIGAQAPEFLARSFEKVPLDRVPHAASWLRGKRWEDEIAPARSPHPKLSIVGYAAPMAHDQFQNGRRKL